MRAHEVTLSELAQGLRPMAEGIEWFEGFVEEEQRRATQSLVYFCGQARAKEEDVPESVELSGIRSTHTPAVMLTRWNLGMAGLPGYELTKSFRLLVALFSIADARRRALYCAGGCSGISSLPSRSARHREVAAAPWCLKP